MLTGLRGGELRSIRIEQVRLDGPLPCLVLSAANAKSGQAAELPLRGDLVADLRDYLDQRAAVLTAEKAKRPTIPLSEAKAAQRAAAATRRGAGDLPADAPLFDLPDQLTRAFDLDLKLTGIPKRDDRGRTADVHSLRHTFATWLSAGGVAPRTAQAGLRHSTLELTMQVYTDPRLLDVAGALDALPQLPLAAVADASGAAAGGALAASGAGGAGTSGLGAGG